MYTQRCICTYTHSLIYKENVSFKETTRIRRDEWSQCEQIIHIRVNTNNKQTQRNIFNLFIKVKLDFVNIKAMAETTKDKIDK